MFGQLLNPPRNVFLLEIGTYSTMLDPSRLRTEILENTDGDRKAFFESASSGSEVTALKIRMEFRFKVLNFSYSTHNYN